MTKKQWETVSTRARALLDYGVAETEWLEGSRMARFIAAVPFLAGCNKALETSFSHLLVYLACMDDSTKELYYHKPEDDGDLYSRLQPILAFYGGNEEILLCCRDLLALCMISNYSKDAEEDLTLGKYNPLNEGVWDSPSLVGELTASIAKRMTPEIAVFYTTEDALRGYWQL